MRLLVRPWLKRVLIDLSDIPSPLGSSGIITLARNSPQNPQSKQVRGQNPRNKGLSSLRFVVLRTVMASTMIARFNFERKVRCHNGPVEKFDAQKSRLKERHPPIKGNECNRLISTVTDCH
jgi:hypothetical protein